MKLANLDLCSNPNEWLEIISRYILSQNYGNYGEMKYNDYDSDEFGT